MKPNIYTREWYNIYSYGGKQLPELLRQPNLIEILDETKTMGSVTISLIATKGKRKIKHCEFKFQYRFYFCQWEYKYFENDFYKDGDRYFKTEQMVKKLQRLAFKQNKENPLNNYLIRFTNIF